MEQKSISILGCGWLGLPLATHLQKHGWEVKGSTTSNNKLSELQSHNISPYQININDSKTIANNDFFESEYLIVNIPPSKTDNYVEAFSNLCTHIENQPISKILFISSTSAYPNTNTLVKENDTEKLIDNTNRTIELERQFQKLNKKLCIVRLAGLVGPGRHPGRFFNNGRILTSPSQPVNLIHLFDCIGLIETILNNQWEGIINGCSTSHPTKAIFYQKACQKLGFELVIDKTTIKTPDFKLVSNHKSQQLGYQYKYDDLMKMLDQNNAF